MSYNGHYKIKFILSFIYAKTFRVSCDYYKVIIILTFIILQDICVQWNNFVCRGVCIYVCMCVYMNVQSSVQIFNDFLAYKPDILSYFYFPQLRCELLMDHVHLIKNSYY